MPEINNEILIWARETRGLSVKEAAKKLQLQDSKSITAEEKLIEYEAGKTPSRSLLVRMSKQYNKPLLSFYMKHPPQKGDRGEDFRTLPAGFLTETDIYVDILIRDIKARQSVLRETLIEEDEAEPLSFIGSASREQNIHEIANAIIQTLNFDIDKFRESRATSDAFKYLRSLAERIGIFVLLAGNIGSHHSNIDANVFRGFVLADDIAPFIIINDQDIRSAWSFTLLHEMVHLWLGQTGVSGNTYIENKIEKLCNDVASEILLPESELNAFEINTQNFEDLCQEISNFAQARNISSTLVSYRLFRQNSIDKNQWTSLVNFYRKQYFANKNKKKENNKKLEGGPNYFIVRRNKLGNALVRFTERMIHSGALTTTKAGLLLGVKPLKVYKLLEVGRTI